MLLASPKDSSAATPDTLTTPAHTVDVASRVDPILTALVTGYAEITPSIAFTLFVGGEVDLTPPDYSIGGPGGGDILVPWPVRPFALAGFTFTTFGSGLFAARTP